MNKIEEKDLNLLHNIVVQDLNYKGAYNIRKNGKSRCM